MSMCVHSTGCEECWGVAFLKQVLKKSSSGDCMNYTIELTSLRKSSPGQSHRFKFLFSLIV